LTIANRTLRIGRPTDMNDPFDGYIDDLFNVELKEINSKANATLIEMLISDPTSFAQRIGVPLEEAIAASASISAASDAQRERLLKRLTSPEIEDMFPELKAERENLEVQRKAAIALFRNSGIFCATRRNDNLLMWAHYAEQHRGVVFGFRPDAERDSFLCLLEPVTYSDIRPTFYKPLESLMWDMSALTPDYMRAFTRSLTAVKGTEWEYEQELRLVIPSYVPEGQDAVFMPFHPHELAELYLGYRVDDAYRDEIVAAARALNKDVRVLQARMIPGAYALTFEPIY
jgi:hypothetical protein